MKISELMERLGELQGEHGDLRVVMIGEGGASEVTEVMSCSDDMDAENPSEVLIL